jgi:hypothetical protein
MSSGGIDEPSAPDLMPFEENSSLKISAEMTPRKSGARQQSNEQRATINHNNLFPRPFTEGVMGIKVLNELIRTC